MKLDLSFIKKNEPIIMLVTGVTGLVSTVFLAVKGHGKAINAMNWDDSSEVFKTTKKGKRVINKRYWVKKTWKFYVPATITGALSTACIIGSYSIDQKRNAALASSLAISEAALTNYQKHVVDTIGEEAEKTIRNQFEADQVKSAPVPVKSSEDKRYLDGDGSVNCYDATTQRKFWASKEDIKRAVNNLNQERLTGIGSYVTLNDFYRELDLESTSIGDIVGWTVDTPVDVSISAIEVDGIPCLYIKPTNWVRI